MENLYPNFSCIPAEGSEENMPAALPENKESKNVSAAKAETMKKIGPAGLLYAIFFTFCLYKNGSGITYPFYAAGSVCFCIYIIRKSGISWKGEHILAPAAGVLLGISTCLTDNSYIILMNKACFLILNLYFLLTVFFQTKGWELGKFITAMLEAVFGSLEKSIFDFFPDLKAWLNERKGVKNNQVFYILAGIACSVPLLAVIIALLSSADMVFKESIDLIFKNIKVWDIFCCLLWTAGVFLFSYGKAAWFFSKGLNETVKDRRTGQPVIAISATAVIAFIYIYFCAIQVIYLFAGRGTLPEGYTYAGYARQGFFQLLFVCLLNLAIVLAGLGFFRESRILKGILLTISFCTFIMIASSFYRMMLYIYAYYLTFLRIFVLWALCVIALLMTGVIIKTLKNSFPLFRYGLAVVVCCYLVLSFGRPDYWIASYNTTCAEADFYYLNRLSADAAPVIMTEASVQNYKAYKEWEEKGGISLTEEAPDCPYYGFMERQERKADRMTLRSYNFSRGYVKKMMEKETF